MYPAQCQQHSRVLQEFSATDYDDLITGWSNKVHRCSIGDQKWGLFYAEKQ